MIDVFPYAGLPIAVFGLGRSGIASALALQKSGAEVWAWDDSESARDAASTTGVTLVDLNSCDWSQLMTLLLSPGIPLHHPAPHPIVTLARGAGVEIIGDIELLARTQRDASYVGVTGTNGKSTTTALIGHILQVSGREAEVGGNLGVPALTLMPMGHEGIYVLEMSSYQLDLTVSITFDVAVLLNISPDHLDRHGGMEGYIAAKKTIFNRQTRPRTAVIGVDDDKARALYEDLLAINDQRVVPVSGRQAISGGVYAENGVLIDDMDGAAVPVMDLKTVATLPGEHNWQNAAAAYAAARATGVAAHAVMACINSYPGLAHRQELIERVDRILFVNDSKATNPDAAAKALSSYDTIYWIAGGQPKEGGLDAVMEHLGNVRHAYLIGEAASAMGDQLNSRVTCTQSGDLATAISAAHAQAVSDGAERDAVVLLSPACASFDQFSDFEARGNAFRDGVGELPGTHTDAEDDDDMTDAMGSVGGTA